MKIFRRQCAKFQTADYWNAQSQKFHKPFFGSPTTDYYLKGERRLIDKYFSDLRDKLLLKYDLWNETHNTRILFYAAEKGAKVYGIDIAHYTILEAKKNFGLSNHNCNLVTGDVRWVPFVDNSFDYIYTMGTIEHFDEVEQAMKEIYRILKDDGIAIIGVPNARDPFLRPFLVWMLRIFELYPFGNEKSFSIRKLEQMLRQVGFNVITRDGVLFVPGILRMIDLALWVKIPSLCFFTKLLLKPFEFLVERWEWLYRHGYLICCVVKKENRIL